MTVLVPEAPQSGFQTPAERVVGSTSQANSAEENSGSSLSSIQGEIDLNKTLEAVDISPARPSDKLKKNVLVDKYDQIKERAKARSFQKVELTQALSCPKKGNVCFAKHYLTNSQKSSYAAKIKLTNIKYLQAF